MIRFRSMMFVVAGALAGMTTVVQAQEARQPSVTAGHLVTGSFVVDMIDMNKREVTLHDENGKSMTITVPESVSRLDNVKKGDTLNVSYYESIALALQKPGTPAGETKRVEAERFPGKTPGGMAIERMTATATISKIKGNEVTLEGANGKKTTLKVDDPQLRSELKNLKTGDEIQATFTQAIATKVIPRSKSE